MAMFSIKPLPLFLGITVLFLLTGRARAFGAGNIAGVSKVEGQNWRHGDIEDALLSIMMARVAGGKKFDKINVSRVYFGNWLRDYSQAIDVGTVKSVSAEAIRLLLSVLGFLSFGYGSREFEVTADRLGCYRPEDHIDNPKNYADNIDARQYDQRLRGPVNERIELGIDQETGMKNYIANERANIMTSALHVRRLFGRCIELGRSYNRSQNKDDLHESLRLLGTGLHCLEDFLAHSNYSELALAELGERDIFPHVGRNTRIRLRGARGDVYPLITGTFGGVDFLHSVTGEVSDKLTQNEIQELEGTLEQGSQNNTSILENILDKIPDGLFGGGGKQQSQKISEISQNAATAQMQQMSVSPREPEEYTLYVQSIFKQIIPAIETHDDIMKSLRAGLEQVPVLPKILEQLEEQLSQWVFSIMAPFVVPVIKQVKNELRTGSSEIIESSKNDQLIVFNDDNCTDPTHSMLSKDHFTNILNEVAGKTASKMVAWVVPQLMDAWDNEQIDINRTLNRIISGVLHHPAQREMGEDGARDGRQIMFASVTEWWQQFDEGTRNEYRRKLSRDGVERGENHKEGQHDTGHGCAGPLKMHKEFGSGNTMEDKIANAAAGAIIGGITGTAASFVQSSTGVHIPSSEDHSETSFGGVMSQFGGSGGGSGGGGGGGDGMGGFLNKIGGGMLGGAFGGSEGGGVSSMFGSRGMTEDGGYKETATEFGRSNDGTRYEQAEYSTTSYGDGSQRNEYTRYEQREPEAGAYGGGGGGSASAYFSGQSGDGSRGFVAEEQQQSSYHQSSESYEQPRQEESSGGFGSLIRQASDAFGGSGGGEYGSSSRRDDEQREEEPEERSEWQEERREEESSGGGWFS